MPTRHSVVNGDCFLSEWAHEVTSNSTSTSRTPSLGTKPGQRMLNVVARDSSDALTCHRSLPRDQKQASEREPSPQRSTREYMTVHIF